jgi:hypothetical protein
MEPVIKEMFAKKFEANLVALKRGVELGKLAK